MPRTDLLVEEIVSHVLHIGDNLRDPLLILDADLRVLSANRVFYETFRVTANDTETKLLTDLGNGQWNIPELVTLLSDIVPKDNSFDGYDVSHDFPDIGQCVMQLNARKLFRASNSTALLVLSIEDITERKSALEAMVVSEMRYRRLFEEARDGIFILDSIHGTITDANPFMTELLGYTHQELLGKELWEIGLLNDEQASRDAFQELKKHGSIRYENLPLESRLGIKHEVEFVSHIYQEGGQTVIQCNIRDITERKLLEGKLATIHRYDKKIATALQRSMLFRPNENAFPGLSVQTVFATASDEALVGGDFWDTLAFDDSYIALVCGDVMGHGLSSAIFTAELKYILRAYIREHKQPSRVLHQMNEYLLESNRLFLAGINPEGGDNPVCLALAIVDRQTGSGTLALAAMEWPLLIRSNGDLTILKVSGLPLGVEKIVQYTQVDFELAVGDTLVMTTDGITEARFGHEFLGAEGLAELAIDNRHGTLKEMGETILNGARDFGGGTLHDDACLVLVRKT